MKKLDVIIQESLYGRTKMTEYLTVRELWLMAMAWNEAIAASSLKERGKMPPQILNWLNTDTGNGLSIRQVLAKAAPKENQDD